MATERLAETLDELTQLIETTLGAEGYELVELKYQRGNKSYMLRITIDRAGRTTYGPTRNPDGSLVQDGVTIADCVRMSKLLSPVLDVEDLVPSAYTLEVSSPGVNRPLSKPEHFRIATGLLVRIKTRVPVAGQTLLIGSLVAANDEQIVLEQKNGQAEVPYRHIKQANLEYEF
ncbi:MAG: ribosome maturation factor RimP [Myxococcota bacterium]|jgi:ribosome maturation factor RimP